MPGSLPGGTRLERPPEGKALSVQPATTYVSIVLATHIGCPLPNFLELEVTSWSKPLVQRSPLWLILTIFLWGILLYPVVTHFPIDYFALFGYLTSFALVASGHT